MELSDLQAYREELIDNDENPVCDLCGHMELVDKMVPCRNSVWSKKWPGCFGARHRYCVFPPIENDVTASRHKYYCEYCAENGAEEAFPSAKVYPTVGEILKEVCTNDGNSDAEESDSESSSQMETSSEDMMEDDTHANKRPDKPSAPAPSSRPPPSNAPEPSGPKPNPPKKPDTENTTTTTNPRRSLFSKFTTSSSEKRILQTGQNKAGTYKGKQRGVVQPKELVAVGKGFRGGALQGTKANLAVGSSLGRLGSGSGGAGGGASTLGGTSSKGGGGASTLAGTLSKGGGASTLAGTSSKGGGGGKEAEKDKGRGTGMKEKSKEGEGVAGTSAGGGAVSGNDTVSSNEDEEDMDKNSKFANAVCEKPMSRNDPRREQTVFEFLSDILGSNFQETSLAPSASADLSPNIERVWNGLIRFQFGNSGLHDVPVTISTVPERYPVVATNVVELRQAFGGSQVTVQLTRLTELAQPWGEENYGSARNLAQLVIEARDNFRGVIQKIHHTLSQDRLLGIFPLKATSRFTLFILPCSFSNSQLCGFIRHNWRRDWKPAKSIVFHKTNQPPKKIRFISEDTASTLNAAAPRNRNARRRGGGGGAGGGSRKVAGLKPTMETDSQTCGSGGVRAPESIVHPLANSRNAKSTRGGSIGTAGGKSGMNGGVQRTGNVAQIPSRGNVEFATAGATDTNGSIGRSANTGNTGQTGSVGAARTSGLGTESTGHVEVGVNGAHIGGMGNAGQTGGAGVSGAVGVGANTGSVGSALPPWRQHSEPEQVASTAFASLPQNSHYGVQAQQYGPDMQQYGWQEGYGQQPMSYYQTTYTQDMYIQYPQVSGAGPAPQYPQMQYNGQSAYVPHSTLAPSDSGDWYSQYQPPLPSSPPPPLPDGTPPASPERPVPGQVAQQAEQALRYPCYVRDLHFSCIGFEGTIEEQAMTDVVQRLVARGSTYIPLAIPGKVNLIALSTSWLNGGIEGRFNLRDFVEYEVAFVWGLMYLDACTKVRVDLPLPQLANGPFMACHPQGILVVTDKVTLTGGYVVTQQMQRLVKALQTGRKKFPHYLWEIKLSPTCFNDLMKDPRPEVIATVSALFNVEQVGDDPVSEVMSEDEQSTKMVQDPPKVVRDAVKLIWKHRERCRYLFLMHSELDGFKTEEIKQEVLRVKNAGDSQTTIITDTISGVVDRVNYIIEKL